MKQAKSFDISKQVVWEAYQRVKANRGSAGVDAQSIQDFEVDLKDNLYKLWNRMASGSYFPPPVRRVEIPKKDGGLRPLGIPTVSDRIAQMVVKIMKWNPTFTRILMVTGRVNQQYRLSAWLGGAVGVITGW